MFEKFWFSRITQKVTSGPFHDDIMTRIDWAIWKSMKYKRTSTDPSYQAILLIPVFGIDGIRKEVEGETLS